MKFNFQNKKISGIRTVIPKRELKFEDYAENFQSTPKQMQRLKETLGLDKRRVSEAGVSTADMATFGIEKILSDGLITKDEIGALILVTQSPDYFLPPTSNIIQGRLNLSTDVYCLDINNGCAGYVVGLMQSFQLLEHMTDKKVLLLAGEMNGTRRAKKPVTPTTNRDSLLWGDAIAISVVDNDSAANSTPIVAEVVNEGQRWDAIISPTKNFKELSANLDSPDVTEFTKSHMNGGEVFKFTQVTVPSIIERLLRDSGKAKAEIDWFLLHQPNKFLTETVIEELGVPFEKAPSNIVSIFGNSSSATIPTNICYNLTPEILKKSFSVCMAGFGTGLTVGVMTMQLGPLNFCDFVEY